MSISITTVRNNIVPNEPSLRDVLNLLKKEINLDLNSHHVGTIQSFNPLTQTAQITINYKKTIFKYDAVTQGNVPTLLDYPTGLDFPVIFLGGGSSSLTFPVQKGDECLVFFNDRDLDNWFQGGGSTAANATGRLHSFSDGIALVGLRSLSNVLTQFDGDRAVFQAGPNAKVAVSDSAVEIEFGDVTLVVNAAGIAMTQGNTTSGLDGTSASLAFGTNSKFTATTGAATVAHGSNTLVADSSGVKMTGGTAVVQADSATSKIKINNGSGNLNTLLQSLMTQLQTLTTQIALLTVTCTAPGNPSSLPINAALITAVGTQIGTIATSLGNLLE